MVSVVVAARNEQDVIGETLRHLVKQDYPNYEIIVVNDHSEDGTRKVVEKFARKYRKIRLIDARKKPDGWVGKSWACLEGYRKALGYILLFTDADTKLSKNVVSMSINHIVEDGIEVISGMPRVVSNSRLVRITTPLSLSLFYSAIFGLGKKDSLVGNFIMMTRKAYRKLGTHEKFRKVMNEDLAMGRAATSKKLSTRFLIAEKFIETLGSRNLSSMYDDYRRWIIKGNVSHIHVNMLVMVLFPILAILPYVTLTYSAFYLAQNPSLLYLLTVSAISIGLIYLLSVIYEKKTGLMRGYSILSPVAAVLLTFAYLYGHIRKKNRSSVIWRGREYSI